jgi:hypothetical protein
MYEWASLICRHNWIGSHGMNIMRWVRRGWEKQTVQEPCCGSPLRCCLFEALGLTSER